MQFIANVPIIFKGDRVERGTSIEMTAEQATNLGDDVTLVGDVVAPEEEAEDVTEGVALDALTVPQLKEKAAALGLKTTGSKADLIERITLGAPVAPEEEAEEELADTN